MQNSRCLLLSLIASASAVAQDGVFVKSSSGCPNFGSVTSAAPHTVLPINGWNLDGRCFTFLASGATDYVVVDGGAWIAPSPSAQIVGPADDIVQGPFSLPFTFTYNGGAGSTTSIDVAPNGHIYLEAGTNQATRCCNAAAALADFLAATPSVAVLGTDLDSTAAGQVLFDTGTSGGLSYATVTWIDVPEWPRNGQNTVQGQLWSDGSIVICHQRTSGSRTLDTALVGVSVGGGVSNPGAVQFNPSLGLRVDTFPNIGSTVTVGVDNVPAGAAAGALLIAAGQTNVPLSLIGGPVGCNLLVNPTFFSAPLSVTAPTASFALPIPNDPGAIGLTLELQAAVADLTQIGSFALPVFVSDRGSMTIGILSNNDVCEGAIAIGDGLTTGDNLTATTGTVRAACTNSGVDVWYIYTASCTGTATATLCSGGAIADYDSTLAAFTGTCGALTQVACNDDFCGAASEITFPVVQGNVYYIAVGGWISATTGPRQGTFTLSMSCM